MPEWRRWYGWGVDRMLAADLWDLTAAAATPAPQKGKPPPKVPTYPRPSRPTAPDEPPKLPPGWARLTPPAPTAAPPGG